MRVLLLSLLACNPNKNLDDEVGPNGIDPRGDDSKVSSAPASKQGQMATRVVASAVPPERRVTKGKAPATTLLQQDCYGGGDRDAMKRRSGPPGRTAATGSRGGRGGPPRSAARPMKPRMEGAPPPPAAAPMANQAPMADGAFGSGSAGGEAQRVQIISGAAKASPVDAAAAPPPAEPVVTERSRRPKGSDKTLEKKEVAAEEEADDEWSRPYKDEPKVAKPVLDWGATVYLSNDDSMSLASAQRLLWAVDQGATFSTGEVRPHELLNYFSFDTAPVAKGETFSVLGGGELNGDTLSVALAVQGAMPVRQPLDLTLVIDRSGSMRAEGRMEYVKKGLLKMTEQLADGDRIDLVLYDSRVCTPLTNYVVGRDDPELLTAEINRMQPRGSTDLDGGLREGYRIQTARDAADTHKRNRRVLLLTDAMLNSGNVNEALVSEIGKRFETDGIRVTGVGVGRKFNDKMLNKITEKGKGAYVYLGSEAVVDRVFGASFDSLVQTIAHDVQFSIELPDSLAMEKFYGEESSTNAEDVQPINYYAGTSQLFLQDLTVRGGKINRSDEITFRAKFRAADTGEPTESVFTTTLAALVDGDTRNLKKAQTLMKWTDLLTSQAMGDRSCSGLKDYRRAASQVQGDAEVAYVSSLTGKLCGVDMSQTMAATGVRFKVKVDADLPIPEVRLTCSGEAYTERLSGSDTVARFEDVVPGSCRLTLQGNVPMVASVDVPSTGGDVRCLVRGGRVQCD